MVQTFVSTHNQANYLKGKRRQVSHNATAENDTGTSSLTAPEMCALLIGAPHSVHRWNDCSVTVIILCATAPRCRLQNRFCAARRCDSDSSQSSVPCLSTAHKLDSVFKRDKTEVISTLVPSPKSPVQICNPAMTAVCKLCAPRTFRIQLFFVLGAVQPLPV